MSCTSVLQLADISYSRVGFKIGFLSTPFPCPELSDDNRLRMGWGIFISIILNSLSNFCSRNYSEVQHLHLREFYATAGEF